MSIFELKAALNEKAISQLEKSEKIVVITNLKTRYNPLDKQNHNNSWDNSQLKQISNFDDANFNLYEKSEILTRLWNNCYGIYRIC
ncbi:hypothetical protein BpHYR1_035276 [Brachionus plicatilis]|uniref:Uncharacterized protein n=1 Tax=Brachionus plicatilis TaxID=10195 RepID=A0A3M7PYH9_BRAPC|nr:hypothetical protein BpHYR1_035276 [Brachionus plicatilis]